MEDSLPDGFNVKGVVQIEQIEDVKATDGGKDFSENEQTIQGQKSLPLEPNLVILPSELLLKIFRFLPHNDIKNAIEVCRKFRDIGTDPLLWSMFSIPARKISHVKGLDRLLAVLKLPRFSKLQILDLNRVNPPWKPTKFLEILTVANKLPLSCLDLSYNNLSSHQTSAFLEVMGRGTSLKQLEMKAYNLNNVPSLVVAKAFNNLERFKVKTKSLAQNQSQILATLQLMAKKTSLKFLMFEYTSDISWVNPGLLARAVVQVKQVVINCTLSNAQVRAISDLHHNDLSGVPKIVLDKAVDIMRGGGNVVLYQVNHMLFLWWNISNS